MILPKKAIKSRQAKILCYVLLKKKINLHCISSDAADVSLPNLPILK
jgi:hypothetical protein